MIGDFFSELVEVVKAYIPDFSFGFLERLVPLLDIHEDGTVVRTDKKFAVIYEIYPRAVSLLTEKDTAEIKKQIENYASRGITIAFYSNTTQGKLEDFEEFLSLYRGKGIFEKEALMRKPLFEKALSRRYFVSFISENKQSLESLPVEEFPFRIKKRLNGDEVFQLYRSIFRDKTSAKLDNLIMSQIERDGYASVRELIFPADMKLHDRCVSVGKWFIKPIEVSVISKTSPGQILKLLSAAEEAYFSLTVRYLPKTEVLKLLENKIRQLKGFGMSRTAVYQKRKLEDMLSQIKLSEYSEPLGRVSLQGLVFSSSEEEVERKAELVRNILGSIGFATYEEIDYAKKTAESLPALTEPKILAVLDDAISSIPAYTRFIGYPRPVLTFEQDKDLVYFDPIDPSSVSWGIGIFGPTGMGKSNIANAILKALKAQGAWIAIMDIGDSYKELSNFVGGEYTKIDIDGRYRINPFQFRFGFDRVPEGQELFVISVLETMLKHQFDPKEKAVLKQFISFLYQERTLKSKDWQEYLSLLKAGYTDKREEEAYWHFVEAMPSLEDMQLFDQFVERLDDMEKEIAQNIKITLKGLSLSKLFAGKTNFKMTSDFTVFELKSLQNYPSLLEAFYMLLQKMINDEVYYSTPEPETTPRSIIDFYGEAYLLEKWKRHKVFLTDEFHFVKNSRQIVEDTAFMYRTGRKKNLVRVLISQFITDLTIFGKDVFEGIIENTAVLFFAPHRKTTESGDQVRAYEAALKETAKVLHLTEEEIREFESLNRGSDYSEYYLVSRDRGRTRVRYKNSPLERWIYATYTRDVVIRDTLIRKYGRDRAYEMLLSLPREQLEKEVQTV
ncbi:VirB4 family type IV secretion system protein [Persephonella sp.]